MVEAQTQTLDRVFLALGHPVRRQILVRLTEGPATVSDIAEPFDMSLNAISKHLKVLESANLIQREVIGREHYCSANRGSLEEVAHWLAYYQSFWSSGFEAIEQELIAKKQAKSLDKG
jgi:DNA-binding transcriptional ArsR family regulator